MDQRVCIIINPNYLVDKWQYNCILKLKDYKLLFLVAKEVSKKKSVKSKRNYLKHFVYYCINLVSIRQRKRRIKFHLFILKQKNG